MFQFFNYFSIVLPDSISMSSVFLCSVSIFSAADCSEQQRISAANVKASSFYIIVITSCTLPRDAVSHST